jgi:hypothetical protein
LDFSLSPAVAEYDVLEGNTILGCIFDAYSGSYMSWDAIIIPPNPCFFSQNNRADKVIRSLRKCAPSPVGVIRPVFSYLYPDNVGLADSDDVAGLETIPTLADILPRERIGRVNLDATFLDLEPFASELLRALACEGGKSSAPLTASKSPPVFPTFPSWVPEYHALPANDDQLAGHREKGLVREDSPCAVTGFMDRLVWMKRAPMAQQTATCQAA